MHLNYLLVVVVVVVVVAYRCDYTIRFLGVHATDGVAEAIRSDAVSDSEAIGDSSGDSQ